MHICESAVWTESGLKFDGGSIHCWYKQMGLLAQRDSSELVLGTFESPGHGGYWGRTEAKAAELANRYIAGATPYTG